MIVNRNLKVIRFFGTLNNKKANSKVGITMKFKRLILIFGLMLLLSACTGWTPATPSEQPDLSFEPKLSMFESGKVQFTLGIANETEQDSDTIAEGNIRAIITDESGEIRNQMTIVDVPAIPGEDTVYPLIYEAVYDPGKYMMSLSGKGITSTALNFEIREVEGVIKLAAQPGYIDPNTEFTLIDPDL
jgi:hypothetical protein